MAEFTVVMASTSSYTHNQPLLQGLNRHSYNLEPSIGTVSTVMNLHSRQMHPEKVDPLTNGGSKHA